VGESRIEPVTVDALLARSDGDGPGDHRNDAHGIDHIVVPPTMLADLHDPGLIITPDYVGPARHMPGGHGPGAVGSRPDALGGHTGGAGHSGGARRVRTSSARSTSIRPIAVAVMLTAATMAPLTLAVSHWMAH
jgi:hypothetical protein